MSLSLRLPSRLCIVTLPILWLVLVGQFAPAGAAEPAPATKPAVGTTRGKIVDQGGRPVVGKITLEVIGRRDRPRRDRPDPAVAAVKGESDRDGNFVLKDVPPGDHYRVRALSHKTRGGEIGNSGELTVEAGHAADAGTIRVNALPD